MEAKFEVHEQQVKGQPEVDRTNEIITQTGWYNSESVVPERKEFIRGRLVEKLKLVKDAEMYTEGELRWYKPAIYMEVRGKERAEEIERSAFVKVHPKLYGNDSKEMFKHFPKAFDEFTAYRGYMNV